MKETLQKYTEKIKTDWQARTKKQKVFFIGSIILFLVFIAGLIYFSTRTTMVPLYSNLTPAETGSIKESLDAKGVKSEIVDGGTTIRVPEESVDSLLVELAAEGIPQSGSIDYSFFSQNAGIGMTDNEFNVMKLDAMQTELANLIKSIDGIQEADVMITLPEKGIFVQDQTEAASASIVLTTEPGYQFSQNQIKTLYTLVSKSVPNLPTDNIVIMNQNFEYFDLESEESFANGNSFETQYAMKKEIERDIQRQVQSMLGTLMGQENVVVSVTADIDFTQETREENLVTPVDEENMEGIAISAQRLSESYTGENANAGGTPQAEDTGDVLTGYAGGTDDNGEYENSEETINYEVNRIRKEIVESPYKIRDLGIQVIVQPPSEEEQNTEINQEAVQQDIEEILSTIIRTTIDKTETDENFEETMENKIAVSFQPLLGKSLNDSENESSSFPLWGYIVIGILSVLVLILLFLFIRNRRTETEDEELFVNHLEEEKINIPDLNEQVETEDSLRRKQIEQMAKERPDEFAKLVRTWLSQE